MQRSLSLRPERPEPWETDGEGAPVERGPKGFPAWAAPKGTSLDEACSIEGMMAEGDLVGVVKGSLGRA